MPLGYNQVFWWSPLFEGQTHGEVHYLKDKHMVKSIIWKTNTWWSPLFEGQTHGEVHYLKDKHIKIRAHSLFQSACVATVNIFWTNTDNPLYCLKCGGKYSTSESMELFVVRCLVSFFISPYLNRNYPIVWKTGGHYPIYQNFIPGSDSNHNLECLYDIVSTLVHMHNRVTLNFGSYAQSSDSQLWFICTIKWLSTLVHMHN